MSDEENLNTHKPTCGTGEPSLHDDEILDLHARLLREKKKPILAFHLVPLILVFLVGTVIFWAGLVISLQTGFWSVNVYDIHWEKSNALAEHTKEAGVTNSGPSAAFKKGKKLFNTPGSCVTCHQANGLGLKTNHWPPLDGSEWVTGSPQVLTRIVLNGVQGPIEVKGEKYGLAPMVPLIWKDWSDSDIAAVLTYVRNAWSNEATEVDAATVSKIRSETGDRGPWTVEELKEFQ
ncbi:MAG: cytochrome c [Opitutae bacterium]|nr:cytochrome c [Opitutae bacterium]